MAERLKVVGMSVVGMPVVGKQLDYRTGCFVVALGVDKQVQILVRVAAAAVVGRAVAGVVVAVVQGHYNFAVVETEIEETGIVETARKYLFLFTKKQKV